MTHIQDNFLPDSLFRGMQNYCDQNPFQIVTAGEKQFSVLQTPPEIIPYLEQPQYRINLTFIREAHAEFDTDYRIHADGIIAGQKTDMASVLYINDTEGVTPNGTAFWEHEKHGPKLPKDFTDEEFDRLLTEDANDEIKWKQLSFVEAKPNRLLLYDANLFHSKYPKQITHGRRIVLVTFYCKIIDFEDVEFDN